MGTAKLKPFMGLAAITLLTTAILWLPFILRIEKLWGIALRQDGMATVVANFDGPYYIVAAKTLYDPKTIESNFSFPLPSIYYSAHYPLYPLLIRLTVTVLPSLTYPYAMILVTVLTSILAVWMFYLLANQVGLGKHSFWLAALFTILPARWLITRSIGSPEPLFIFATVASIYFFRKQNFYLTGLFGAVAVATKSPGILLLPAFAIALVAPYWSKLAHTDTLTWIKRLPWKAYPLLLIPTTLVAIFLFYGYRYGSFFAYFNSGDNIHLMFPPFQVFNPNQTWVGTFWLEEIIWIYLLALLGVVYLVKLKEITLACFVGVFLLSILFVSHRDIARYSLPIVPFLFIAFHKILISPYFKWIILVLLIPIYLFSLAFLTNNVTPIPDWGQLL